MIWQASTRARVISISAALGLLVAEGRAGVVDPDRQRPVAQVLDVGAHDGGGQLRSQAQLPIPVGEAVHAGGDLLAGLAEEQVEVLQHRGVDATVAEPLEMVAQMDGQATQTGIIWRQGIVHPTDSLDFERLHS